MEPIKYTHNQPVWWLRSRGRDKALFVAYRKSMVVIDILYPDGSTRRKLAKIEAIQPREEENGKKEETTI